MIRSMTGFGREQRIINGREITAEIRAVNHRYNEFTARVPRQYAYLEEKLKKLIGSRTSRGKVEIGVTICNISGKEVKVTANIDVIESYLSALYSLQSKIEKKGLPLDGELSLADVFRIPEAFTVVKSEVDEEEVWAAVEEVASAALAKFVAMRETEGEKMKADILERLALVETKTAEIDSIAPDRNAKYRARLLEKMREFLDGGAADEQRILLEAALFAEKAAVDEETVRLNSHIAQARELLETENAVGRKLDFLVQEMNREINTIGSKANDITVTRIVVDLKAELEKIREQIQNIE